MGAFQIIFRLRFGVRYLGVIVIFLGIEWPHSEAK